MPSQGVRGPNSLWHIDGLHCLISWRFLIHGDFDRALDFVVQQKILLLLARSVLSCCAKLWIAL